MIKQSRIWTRQPQYSARPNQLWKPSGLWNFATQSNAVSGALNTITSAAAQSFGPLGIGTSVSGTGSLNRHILNSHGTLDIGSGDFTAFVAFRLDSTAGYSALSRWNTGGSAGSNVFLLGASSGFAAASVSFLVEVGTSSYEANASATWTAGETYLLFGRRKGTTIYVDLYTLSTGALVSGFRTDAGITSINEVSARSLKLGELDASASLNANITGFLAATFKRCITDAEMRILIGNPWQLFAPQTSYLFASPSGGTTYSLPADSGSIAITGTAASIKFNRSLSAGVGALNLAGTDAALKFNRVLACDAGSIAVTGTDATLTYSGAGAPTYTLTAEGGSVAITGIAASLKFNRLLNAASGAIVVTGSAVTLTYSGASGFTVDQLAYLDAKFAAVLAAIPSAATTATAVLAAAQTTPIHSDVRKVVGITVDGTGTDIDPWGPA